MRLIFLCASLSPIIAYSLLPRGDLQLRAAAPLMARPRAARMQVETVRVTVTLTGCKSGVGLGLDKENVVDMLKPDMPAVRVLEMGDKLVSWNGQEMGTVENGKWKQRPLRDVVKSADTHTVVVERAKTSWSAGLGYETPEWQQGNSWEQGGGSSSESSSSDPPDWASPLG